MTVYAGDDAIYTPRRGAPSRVRVMAITPKRVAVMALRGPAFNCFRTIYVKPERLERVAGGGAC